MFKRSCLWGFAAGLLFSATAIAQENVSPRQERTRNEFSRYFEAQRRMGGVTIPPVGERRLRAANAIKLAPGGDPKRQRLLDYQEQRTPQPDVRSFMANNPVLEEVAEGEDRDFAQVIFWNEVALRITANDHTPPPPGSTLDTHPFEQVGPVRTIRALAIVHIAIFEAINAIQRQFGSYEGIQARIFQDSSFPADITAKDASIRHAIAIAAHRTLLELYPQKASDLAFTLASNLTAIQETSIKATAGIAIGDAAARAILQLRKLDGSELPDPGVENYQTTDPRKWMRDPLSLDIGTALGGNWSHVKPFVIDRADSFRSPAPPDPTTDRYKEAFREVFDKGGDPIGGVVDPPGNADRRQTPTSRTPEETFIGKFWAYDGTALLCAPPRLYNMIATSLALREKRSSFPDALQLARFLAMANVAMADAGLSAWEAKYFYLYPRPITVIRAAMPGTSPIPAASPFWTPLGAPVTNAKAGRLNFSPPFPAYPSGHATFGGALFQVFRKYWPDANDQSFTFVSDEYNGLNSDPGSPTPRMLKPMTFANFAAAESLNAESRIFLGIHWRFDAEAGIQQGNQVANYVFDHVFGLANP